MKIWITRSDALSLQCGGLERLFAWFRSPIWVEKYYPNGINGEDIFDEPTVRKGIRIAKWEVIESGATWIDSSISFGKLFGYGDRDNKNDNYISTYVWEKLCEHFGNVEFEKWEEYEKTHSECCQKNFKLEIDLDCLINQKNKLWIVHI